MKLKSIETWSNQYIGVTRLTSEDGAVGWGQLSTYYSDITAQVLHRQVATHVLGEEISSLDSIDRLVDRATDLEFKFPGSYVRRAVGGVDTALWDMHGKLEGKSVCELLGGTPRLFPVYASSMRRDITPEDEAARLADLAEKEGYTAFKFRIGSEVGQDRDEWPGRTEAIVPAVRRALGDDIRLLVDANCCYSPSKAIEVGHFLNDHGIIHYEEPCRYWEYEQTAEVTAALAALPLAVTGGEQNCQLPIWRRMINMRAFDVVQPDVLYLGGISRTLRVAKMAQQAGLICTPHSANRSLVTIFTLHLMGALENAGPYVELEIEGAPYYDWQAGLYDPVIKTIDGRVQIPEGPGWGVEIRPEWLEKAAYQISQIT